MFASHLERMKVDVEKRALSPVTRLDQATGREQAAVQRRARKCRLNRDLDVETGRFIDELRYAIKYFFRISIEPENETGVHGNPVGLYVLDGGAIVVAFAVFPI